MTDFFMNFEANIIYVLFGYLFCLFSGILISLYNTLLEYCYCIITKHSYQRYLTQLKIKELKRNEKNNISNLDS